MCCKYCLGNSPFHPSMWIWTLQYIVRPPKLVPRREICMYVCSWKCSGPLKGLPFNRYLRPALMTWNTCILSSKLLFTDTNHTISSEFIPTLKFILNNSTIYKKKSKLVSSFFAQIFLSLPPSLLFQKKNSPFASTTSPLCFLVKITYYVHIPNLFYLKYSRSPLPLT